jgi:hypothetical protein
MVTRTRDPIVVRQTGFVVGATDVRFGILVAPGEASMPDWAGSPQIPVLVGAGVIVTQVLMPSGPRQATYRLLLESIEEAQDLEGLVGQTGVLTLFHGMHTAVVTNAQEEWILGKLYDHIDDVTLMLIANRIVFPISGRVELDATFQAD